MTSLSRRQFVAIVGLSGAFAAAVSPVSATTIVTDTAGLSAGTVEIPGRDRPIPAYRAQPLGRQNLPTILVVSEIFGVHAYIQDICRRLAKLGYLVIAPDFFLRQGAVTQETSIDRIRAIVAQVPDAQVMGDLDAAADWAKVNGGNPRLLGITGFCWGGRITWLYGAHRSDIRAGVAWYGRLVGESSSRQPRHPLDVATQLRCPVLGLYGDRDTGIPNETVAQMQAKLVGTASKIILYPNVGHAFHADYRPSYDRATAEQGWQESVAWFRRWLS